LEMNYEQKYGKGSPSPVGYRVWRLESVVSFLSVPGMKPRSTTNLKYYDIDIWPLVIVMFN